jgi:hypothetical protein
LVNNGSYRYFCKKRENAISVKASSVKKQNPIVPSGLVCMDVSGKKAIKNVDCRGLFHFRINRAGRHIFCLT